jgi:hypothetical protein
MLPTLSLELQSALNNVNCYAQEVRHPEKDNHLYNYDYTWIASCQEEKLGQFDPNGCSTFFEGGRRIEFNKGLD